MSSKAPKKKKPDGLTHESLNRLIEEGRVDPLYLFLGEEVYLQEQALHSLCETIDEPARMFNVGVFAIGADSGSGSRITTAQAIDAANQLPMMSARRVVVIREFDKIKEDEHAMVLGYLKRPSPTTTVVFQAVTADQRRKITTALMKSCTVVVFDLLKDEEARRFAEGHLKRRGCRAEPRALDRLIALAGTRLSRLVNELDKLAAYAGGDIITEAAVLELVPRSREHTSWELWDAIIRRDNKRAMRLIKHLLDDGDTGAPVMIVGSLASLFRRMLAGKELLDRGASFEDFARAINQWRDNATKWRMRLSQTPRAEIVHGLHRIAQVDNAIKNGEATPRLQMEYLVAELMLPSAPRFR